MKRKSRFGSIKNELTFKIGFIENAEGLRIMPAALDIMNRIFQNFAWLIRVTLQAAKSNSPADFTTSRLHDFLTQRIVEKERVVGEVALEEAARFFAEAVEPFDAVFLHPVGGLFHLASVKSEGSTDAEVNGGWELVFVFSNPVFLFRASKADPDEIGARFADFFANTVKLIFWPVAKRWGIGTSDDSVWVIGGKAGLEFFQGAFFSSKEKMFELGLVLRSFDGFKHQSGTVNAIGEFFGFWKLPVH